MCTNLANRYAVQMLEGAQLYNLLERMFNTNSITVYTCVAHNVHSIW